MVKRIMWCTVSYVLLIVIVMASNHFINNSNLIDNTKNLLNTVTKGIIIAGAIAVIAFPIFFSHKLKK